MPKLLETIAVGAVALDLYAAARNSAPAPWVSAHQLWDAIHGDAPGFPDFVKTWGAGTGPYLVRETSDMGKPLMLIAPTVARDMLNAAPATLSTVAREAIEAALAAHVS